MACAAMADWLPISEWRCEETMLLAQQQTTKPQVIQTRQFHKSLIFNKKVYSSLHLEATSIALVRKGSELWTHSPQSSCKYSVEEWWRKLWLISGLVSKLSSVFGKETNWPNNTKGPLQCWNCIRNDWRGMVWHWYWYCMVRMIWYGMIWYGKMFMVWYGNMFMVW